MKFNQSLIQEFLIKRFLAHTGWLNKLVYEAIENRAMHLFVLMK